MFAGTRKLALLSFGIVDIVPTPPGFLPLTLPAPMNVFGSLLHARTRGFLLGIWLGMVAYTMTGCGTTKNMTATEQLLLSDAVDEAVAKIDFTPLVNQKVYFDTQYLKNYKGVGFVNSEYVISSLRQQMAAAGLQMFDAADAADFIIEGRLGALGSDAHEVVYGIPSTSALNDAADVVSAVSQVPKVPGIPELALAKRSNQVAAAKLAVFAYERESRERVWQSGVLTGKSTAKDLWVFGAGPFQRGTIHQGNVDFAGSSLEVPMLERDRSGSQGPIASYRQSTIFSLPDDPAKTQIADEKDDKPEIQQVSGEQVPTAETKK